MCSLKGKVAERLPAESSVAVHNFSAKIFDSVACFHVIKLHGSFFLWVGDAQKNFTNLSMAITTRFVSHMFRK